MPYVAGGWRLGALFAAPIKTHNEQQQDSRVRYCIILTLLYACSYLANSDVHFPLYSHIDTHMDVRDVEVYV